MTRSVNEIFGTLPSIPDPERLWDELLESIEDNVTKVIVLDDDPTGVQTVHNVPVYTSWSSEVISRALNEQGRVVFFLTNSRALEPSRTQDLHAEFAKNLIQATCGKLCGIFIVSRSDSTLRGHYPLETGVLRSELASCGVSYDGEVIIPAFFEGNRVTIDDVHYLRSGGELIPVAQTEFAQDPSFGYSRSDLKEWVEEKTQGAVPKGHVVSVSIPELRAQNEGWLDKVRQVRDFGKIVVNAISYEDLALFALGILRLWGEGRRYLFRTAASWVRVLGGISPRPLLTSRELMRGEGAGLVVVGSYVQKTTVQLRELLRLDCLRALEFDVFASDYDREVGHITREVNHNLRSGIHTVVYTTRELLLPGTGPSTGHGEDSLTISSMISDAIVRVVRGLEYPPGYIVAKGGITSSDLAVKGLGVRRAMVLGQVAPGVPVWRLGPESRFPDLPYVVFPGNVGEASTLREVVEKLLQR